MATANVVSGQRHCARDTEKDRPIAREAYAPACVGLARAQAIATMIAPLDMRGLPGVMEMLGALSQGLVVDLTPPTPAESEALMLGTNIGGDQLLVSLAVRICYNKTRKRDLGKTLQDPPLQFAPVR